MVLNSHFSGEVDPESETQHWPTIKNSIADNVISM